MRQLGFTIRQFVGCGRKGSPLSGSQSHLESPISGVKLTKSEAQEKIYSLEYLFGTRQSGPPFYW